MFRLSGWAAAASAFASAGNGCRAFGGYCSSAGPGTGLGRMAYGREVDVSVRTSVCSCAIPMLSVRTNTQRAVSFVSDNKNAVPSSQTSYFH